MPTWTAGDRWDPGNPENRERTRELVRQLRALLLRWDPIGVADAPEAQDEYDGYISPLLRLLQGGPSADEVTDYLCSVVEDRFGIPAQPARERDTAVRLLAWWQESTNS